MTSADMDRSEEMIAPKSNGRSKSRKSKSLIKENIPISPMWLFVHHHLGSLTIGRSKILD